METLPLEIAEQIFQQILSENPQDFYQLRTVSRAWKNIIDRCAERLYNLWCNKCLDEIGVIYLDQMVHNKFPKFATWLEFRRHKYPLPHIAQTVYESWKEFPNLVHTKIRFAKICPTPEYDLYIDCILAVSDYAVNDKYLAISWMPARRCDGSESGCIRIYSIHDLGHHIHQYPGVLCGKMNFYATDNRIFLVFLEFTDNCKFQGKCVHMIEFLENKRLIPANLPAVKFCSVNTNYVITKNLCFTYKVYSNWIRHQRFTPVGFQPGTEVQVPQARTDKSSIINRIQIFNSTLFVSVTLSAGHIDSTIVIHEYQITRQDDGNLSLSIPKMYQRNIIIRSTRRLSRFYCPSLTIDFANVPVSDYTCDIYPRQLRYWVKKFFKFQSICEVMVYAHHVLIGCFGGLAIFQGTLSQLMNYAVKNRDPGSRCSFITWELFTWLEHYDEYGISIIRREEKPKFLLIFRYEAFVMDFIP